MVEASRSWMLKCLLRKTSPKGRRMGAENFLKLAGSEERTPPVGRMNRSFHHLCGLDQSMRGL